MKEINKSVIQFNCHTIYRAKYLYCKHETNLNETSPILTHHHVEKNGKSIWYTDVERVYLKGTLLINPEFLSTLSYGGEQETMAAIKAVLKSLPEVCDSRHDYFVRARCWRGGRLKVRKIAFLSPFQALYYLKEQNRLGQKWAAGVANSIYGEGAFERLDKIIRELT